MDRKLMIGLAAVLVVVIAVAAVLTIGSDKGGDRDREASPFDARVYLDDGTSHTEYSGTGTSIRGAIQDALSGHDVVFASNGNITSVDGVANSGDSRWVVFKWASPGGWSAVTDISKGTHDGADLAVRYSERVKDDQGNVSYSTPDIQVKHKVYFFIQIREQWDATSWLRDLPFTESQKREGFWISGEGNTNNEALADAVLKNFYPNSKVEIRGDNIIEYIVDGRGDDIRIPDVGTETSMMNIPNNMTLNLGFNAGSTYASDMMVCLVDSEGKSITIDGKAVTTSSNSDFKKMFKISSSERDGENKFNLEISDEVHEWIDKKCPGHDGYGFEVYGIDEKSDRKTGSVILTPSKDAKIDLPFFKYLSRIDMFGWFLSFLGWSDTPRGDEKWTFWTQYSYNPDAETDDDVAYWDFNQWSFGMYDISKYHYFALVLRTSESSGESIDLPTPSEIPESLL